MMLRKYITYLLFIGIGVLTSGCFNDLNVTPESDIFLADDFATLRIISPRTCRRVSAT